MVKSRKWQDLMSLDD